MVHDVEKYISMCETCQTTKHQKQHSSGLLHQLLILEIAMDFIGPFPKSLEYNYLWVVICHLTLQVHLIPVKMTINALELVYEFLKGMVCLHGLPVSDRDTKFTSKFWMELH